MGGLITSSCHSEIECPGPDRPFPGSIDLPRPVLPAWTRPLPYPRLERKSFFHQLLQQFGSCFDQACSAFAGTERFECRVVDRTRRCGVEFESAAATISGSPARFISPDRFNGLVLRGLREEYPVVAICFPGVIWSEQRSSTGAQYATALNYCVVCCSHEVVVVIRNLLRAVGLLLLRKCTRNRYETIDAYCPDCGGVTLIRAVAEGTVYCPQCRNT